MAEYRYRIVDVFTSRKMEGNPLAVFPDAAALDGETMQKIAQELNLAETAFVLPSTREGCVARVRIFTPAREMVFAGHPTIGTCWVLLDEGLVPGDGGQFSVDELVGAVPVRTEGSLLWLQTPPITFGPCYSHADCAAVIGVPERDLLPAVPQLVTAGNPCLFIALQDAATVDRAVADPAALRRLRGAGDPVCVFVFTPVESGAYSRMFAPEHGIVEDPATGSATGPLFAYMMANGLAPSAGGTRLVSEQGVKMGRRSLLHVLIRGDRGADGIDVGGSVVPLMRGVLEL